MNILEETLGVRIMATEREMVLKRVGGAKVDAHLFRTGQRFGSE